MGRNKVGREPKKRSVRVTGICKDCRWRWRYGAFGNPEHLFCEKDSRIVKNPAMKACVKYEQASLETLKHFKKCGLGGIGKI